MEKRLLFLSLGPFYYPDQIPLKDKFALLSTLYSGDIFAVLNNREFNRARLSRFELHGLYLPTKIRRTTVVRNAAFAVFALVTGAYRHWFRKKYDVILAPDPLVSGLIAIALRYLTGARVIVEIRGQFESAFRFEGNQRGFKARLRWLYVSHVLPYVVSKADGVKLLYAEQLRAFEAMVHPRSVHSFADYVPVRRFRGVKAAEKYALFIGYPWKLKGVDVLIKAFNGLRDEFPEWSLKIFGFCPDRAPFESLASGNDRVHFGDPVEYPEVIKLMSECSLFVLPSRTEAMGRVILEAMASEKPVIGSAVDGIPFVISHGDNGLLFRSDDVADLTAKMRQVMGDPDYAARLARNGLGYVNQHLSESGYLDRFRDMLETVTDRKPAAPAS